MTSPSVCFAPEKLWFNKSGGNNYQAWRTQVLYLFQRQGLHGFIDGSNSPPPVVRSVDRDNWTRTDQSIKQGILSLVEEGVAPDDWVGDDTKTSRDVWLALQTRFEPSLNQQCPITTDGSRSSSGDPSDTNTGNGNNGRDWDNQCSLVYNAALRGDCGAAESIFNNNAHMIEAKINTTEATALHISVGAGRKAIDFVHMLVNRMPDNLIVAKDAGGNTALSIAAAVGNKVAATTLVGKNSDLLYMPNNLGALPVHEAAKHAKRDVLIYLLSVTMEYNSLGNPYKGLSGLQLLISTIQADFYAKGMLKRVWENFWRIFRVCGSRVMMPGKYNNPGVVKQQLIASLVKFICDEMKSLSTMEAEHIYRDAILIAAKLDNHEIVEAIVEAFPSAMYCTNPAFLQNIFHVAVENRSEHVFNLIYQMSDHKYLYLEVPDVNGNNLLHLAGKLAPPRKLNGLPNAALKMKREMQWFKEVEKLVKPHGIKQLNYAGKSPRTVFEEEHKELRKEGEEWAKSAVNSCTVTAALISTIMFAAAITVPGGNNSDNGFPLFGSNSVFVFFAVSDAISLISSATSLLVFLDISTSRYVEEDFLFYIPLRLIIGMGSLIISIVFMMLTFSATLYLVFGQKHAWVLVSVIAVSCYIILIFYNFQKPLIETLWESTRTYLAKALFGKRKRSVTCKKNGKDFFRKQSDTPFY